MSIPATPTNFYAQTGNGQALVSWDLAPGATSYSVQRSTDGVTFSVLATPAPNKYSDTTVVLGTQYYYKVAAVNADGTSPYTNAQSIVPSPTGELSLGELRNRSQQRADMLNSNFVTLPEWNFFINQAMFELYDILVTNYEDYFVATPAMFTTDGSSYLYPLPNGVINFTDPNGSSFVAKPFYKLLGVDLGISGNQSAWVTVNNFNFIERNKYVFPNTGGTLYGVFNLQYRIMGNNLEFIPPPSANQPIRVWYIPRLDQLLQDNDLTTTGISGWLQYVIVRAAKYALDKQESDTSKLDAELLFLQKRIEESAMNRDAGQPQKVSDTRSTGWGPYGPSFNGPVGGF